LQTDLAKDNPLLTGEGPRSPAPKEHLPVPEEISLDLHCLSQLCQLVINSDNTQEIYKAAVHCLKKALAADGTALMLIDRDGGIKPCSSLGMPRTLLHTAKSKNPWSNRPEQPPAPILIPDTGQSPGTIMPDRATGSLGYFPLLYQQRLLGFFIVRYRTAHAFSQRELLMAQNIAGYIAVSAERKRAVEATADEKERLVVTLQSIGDGVITTDRRGRIVMMNKAAEELTAWRSEQAIGEPLEKIFHIIDFKTRKRCENPAKKVLETGKISGLASNTALIAQDGTERLVASTGSPIRDEKHRIIGVILVFRDITERKKKEEEFLKASKLESIGILAGGIAHDFNNILTAMLMNISLAKMLTAPTDKVHEILTKAEKASQRAKDLTHQLLTFSKGGAPIKKTASIKEIIVDTASFALRGSNVRCEFMFAPELWPVEVDEGQISQVFNNLVINADQAMPDGGIIFFTCENTLIGPEHALPLQNGPYVKITVKDQGIGIPKEHFGKIFDPYFTTKERGSGLGLATSYAIIRNHGGLISLESELGVGSTFTIYLPASQKKEQIPLVCDPSSPGGNKGRILIMDDEEAIRDVVGNTLTLLGYSVDFAKDGAEAIARYQREKEAGHPFDLVIMDLTIPGGMGGKEAVRALKNYDPQIKAIVSSGYSNDPVMANFRNYGFCGFVAKPFHIHELEQTLQNILRAPTAARTEAKAPSSPKP
jgi:PAS domain S-box-containing protein